ncbi:Golgi apparatus protein 1-like [Neolamprologus brichardi]|uniref:Golgi apparatus protein 1-like n=1 Tax=Neolamprologus brichardi TaxID=32507 RepID=UPI001643F7B5|nr:Golgi apparatus protein 1-like [Neolamprologus brichardi]
MADCIRVPLLLLLMCIFLFVHPIQAQNKAISKLIAGVDKMQNPVGGLGAAAGNPGVEERNQGAGASLSRRRSTGWKLAEEAVCRDDLTRLCPKHSWNNNLAVLECLQDRKEDSEIAAECNHLLWNYKLNLTTDPKFESVAVEVCKTTISEIKECAAEELGKGYLVSCLVDHRGNITDYQCNQYITKMTTIVFSDYRLICGFMDKCRDDINALKCGSISTGEKVRRRDVGLQRKKLVVFDECCLVIGGEAADVLWSRWSNICTLAGEGRVYKCLFNHKFEDSMSERCREALTTRQKLIAQDYKVSYSLAKACKSDLRKYHCNVDTSMPRAREARLSYLLLCLESAVHREPGSSSIFYCVCAFAPKRQLQVLICLSHPVSLLRLDPILYKKCQSDASRLCHTHGWNETSELMPPGAIFSCLYRHAYRSLEQGRRVSLCRVEVQRILHQRALDVKLDPELQRRCMTDLGKWCSEKTEAGQELECLQDHLDDLVADCKEVVGNLTELESEDIQIEALLMRACDPVIQAHCHEVADNQIDSGDLMECLVQNKHQKEMNEKCAVGVTHFQLIQVKDFRFSYKFKTACKEDVLKLCPNIKKKVDVVICLSTTVRNDTLQDAKEQRVSVKCRKQLRVEEVEMSEDIRLEPELYDSCKTDIGRLCQNVAFGNAQVQRFCTESEGKNVLQCLKQNKNSEVMDPKCKQMITKRQITQNTDYRLNPVLRKACKADIPKFCDSILKKAKDETELEGQVISCLKLKYADQRLSPDCEDQIRVILQESALDYRLDPQLQIQCAEEISSLCTEEAAAQEQTGQVEECLKINLLKLKKEGCKKEVLNMLKESKADIYVDPVLHTACALDIKHHCAAIPPGKGRQMSCLMEALQDKRIRLQPECKKRLQDRIDMWSYAAKVHAPSRETPVTHDIPDDLLHPTEGDVWRI